MDSDGAISESPLPARRGARPYYERSTHSIRFVDILKKQLHTVSLANGPSSVTSIMLDEPISVTGNLQRCDPSENVLASLKYGIAVLDRKTGIYEYLSRFGVSNTRIRSNDGAVDANGKFSLGTMTDFDLRPPQREGRSCYFELICLGLRMIQAVFTRLIHPSHESSYFITSRSRIQ